MTLHHEMSRFSTREGFMILVLSISKFSVESYDENRFKIGYKVSEIQLFKLGNPWNKSFEKNAFKFQENTTEEWNYHQEKHFLK